MPIECPEYRIRLFLSVDLVGSTAFKANSKDAEWIPGESRLTWVQRFRDFYRRFPELVESEFRRQYALATEAKTPVSCPRLWKTIGDEILFCCTIRSHKALSSAVAAFLKAVEQYGETLGADGLPLDVKGSGWVAAFPAENISMRVDGGEATATLDGEDYVSEAFEAGADDSPNIYDFLGRDIDAGFRVAKHASTEQCVVSVELAYLLACAGLQNLFTGKFSFHGKQILKGVNSDRPYPIISIDTQRSATKRELTLRERTLTGRPDAPALHLRDYLKAFSEDQGMHLPTMPHDDGTPADSSPEYVIFRKDWEKAVSEVEKREANEATAAGAGEDEGSEGEVPAQVVEWLQALLKGMADFRNMTANGSGPANNVPDEQVATGETILKPLGE